MIIIFLFSLPALAWNSMGHRIIAAIAYQHLTPEAKEKSNQLIDYMADAFPYSSSFQTASTWADSLKQDDVHAFDNWHFYNQPLSLDGAPTLPAGTPNLVWAINQSTTVLESPKSNQYEKAFFLRFLLHLTGDASQPLHCINAFSKQFPQGDEGGNLSHLHPYWDDGAGLFQQHCGFSRSKARIAQCFADKIQDTYPESYFGATAQDLNPNDWVKESYTIAKNNIYENPQSQTDNQIIAEKQLALAGYRLANSLNSIFGASR